jgi:hypothetical protein
MRRKRKRSIKWRAILFVLLIANVITGLLISPITAARTVRVVGALPEDQAYLTGVLNQLRDVPFLRANGNRIESDTLKVDRIRSASFSQNLFGRGLLEVRYRTPVASLEAAPSVKLSQEGELYYDDREMPDLPKLRLPQEAFAPNLTVAFPAELKILAKLCEASRTLQLGDEVVVESESQTGKLCLNSKGNGKVVLGSSERLDEKLSQLRAYLNGNPGVLSRVSELNMTSPDHPALTPSSAGGQTR